MRERDRAWHSKTAEQGLTGSLAFGAISSIRTCEGKPDRRQAKAKPKGEGKGRGKGEGSPALKSNGQVWFCFCHHQSRISIANCPFHFIRSFVVFSPLFALLPGLAKCKTYVILCVLNLCSARERERARGLACASLQHELKYFCSIFIVSLIGI